LPQAGDEPPAPEAREERQAFGRSTNSRVSIAIGPSAALYDHRSYMSSDKDTGDQAYFTGHVQESTRHHGDEHNAGRLTVVRPHHLMRRSLVDVIPTTIDAEANSTSPISASSGVSPEATLKSGAVVDGTMGSANVAANSTPKIGKKTNFWKARAIDVRSSSGKLPDTMPRNESIKCHTMVGQCGQSKLLDPAKLSVNCVEGVCTEDFCCREAPKCSSMEKCSPWIGIELIINPDTLEEYCLTGECSSELCCMPAPMCESFQACGSNRVMDSSKAKEPCMTGTCTVDECCMEAPRCGSLECGINRLLDPNKTSDYCPSGACSTSECCMDSPKCSTVEDCGENMVLDLSKFKSFCPTGICNITDCCKVGPKCGSFTGCGENHVPSQEKSSTFCANGLCTADACCHESPKCRSFSKCGKGHVLQPEKKEAHCPGGHCTQAFCCWTVEDHHHHQGHHAHKNPSIHLAKSHHKLPAIFRPSLVECIGAAVLLCLVLGAICYKTFCAQHEKEEQPGQGELCLENVPMDGQDGFESSSEASASYPEPPYAVAVAEAEADAGNEEGGLTEEAAVVS